MAEFKALVNGRSKKETRSKLLFDDITTNVGVQVEDGTWRIAPIVGANHPKTLEEFRESLEARYQNNLGFPALKLNFRVKSIPRRVALSSLRSAYLATFALYGYRYALRPVLDVVRHQIADPDKEIIQKFSIQLTEATGAEDGIIHLWEPDWIQGIGVKMSETLVFLPWRDDDFEFYERMATQGYDGRHAMFQGDGHTIPRRPAYMLDFD